MQSVEKQLNNRGMLQVQLMENYQLKNSMQCKTEMNVKLN